MLVFGLGSVCLVVDKSYSDGTTASGILLGRVIAGVGAAGSIAGTSVRLVADTAANRGFSMTSLILYSLARFLGPL